MKITPKEQPGRPGYRAVFRDPRDKKIITRGLDTKDGTEAQRICNDIVTIFSKPALLKDDKNPALLAYHRRSVAIVHGDAAADALFARQQKPVLDQADVDTLGARILAVIEDADASDDKQALIDLVLKEFESQRYKELQDRFEQTENRLKVLEPMVADQQATIDRFRREQNLHIQVTMGDAVAKWKTWYEKDHAPITYNQAVAVVDGFMAALPDGKDFKLGEVRSTHVNTWLDGLKRKDGGKGGLSATSRKNMRAYLSSFFHKWAKSEYTLFESPLNNARSVEGVARSPESIVAIRRREDLDAFLLALKPFPYWRAWAAIATLSGLRYSEMVWLKVSDVYLDDGHLRITTRDFNGKRVGTKTGRERSAPIEQTTATAIIKAHLETRQAEQKKQKGTPAETSPWLFPSTLPEHEYLERKKSLVGQWSHNATWRGRWDEIVKQITTKIEGDGPRKRPVPEYWTYGPAEWRHSFGTCAYMCGWSALEISRAMGNSPTVCEKRYISGVTPAPDKRWPYKWS